MKIGQKVIATPPMFAGATDGENFHFERGKAGKVIGNRNYGERGVWALVSFPLAFSAHERWIAEEWLTAA